MALRECKERLLLRSPVCEIALQDPLDGLRCILSFHVVEDLASERRLRTETAADQNVIALNRVAIVGHFHLGREQADVADIVLRAGMVAAREVNVDRSVELDARLAPEGDILGMTFGVRG